MPSLSNDKLALVHVAKRDLRLDDAQYRAILREQAGVSSAKDLGEAGFREVMAFFELCGFKPKGPGAKRVAEVHAPSGDRIGMATQPQLDYIRGMFSEWLGRTDEGALVRWIEGRYHVSAIRFLDAVTASKAITGLKKMVERKRDAAAWAAVAKMELNTDGGTA